MLCPALGQRRSRACARRGRRVRLAYWTGYHDAILSKPPPGLLEHPPIIVRAESDARDLPVSVEEPSGEVMAPFERDPPWPSVGMPSSPPKPLSYALPPPPIGLPPVVGAGPSVPYDDKSSPVPSQEMQRHARPYDSLSPFWQQELDRLKSVELREMMAAQLVVMSSSHICAPDLLDSSDADGSSAAGPEARSERRERRRIEYLSEFWEPGPGGGTMADAAVVNEPFISHYGDAWDDGGPVEADFGWSVGRVLDDQEPAMEASRSGLRASGGTAGLVGGGGCPPPDSGRHVFSI